MSKREFKFIKGKCTPGSPADICFYTDVDYWSVDNFLWEFDYLVNAGPSEIRIHINSGGGSVVEGMSVFSKIIDCPIRTKCINDALAASMGSIIWAAGDELYMKDYALLMIHNPFCDVDGEQKYNQVTEAFGQQLKTIYMKRFCKSEEEVQEIMDGKEGNDGTFLTAEQAVELGFIKQENIIETPKAIKDRISAALNDVSDITKIKAIYGLIPSDNGISINIKNKNKKSIMEKNEIDVLAALFGLTGEKATIDNVTAEINNLKGQSGNVEALTKSLNDTKAELSTVQAELLGAQTSVKNLTEDLNKAKAELKVYQDAETKAKEDKANALIDQAIADCKINKDERDMYIKIANDNYELAESVLSKIPARDKISGIIGQANQEEAKNSVKSTEEQVAARVNEVVGQDFAFRTLG